MSEWKLFNKDGDEDIFIRQYNDNEKEYLHINKRLKRISFIYHYFVLKDESLYVPQQEEKNEWLRHSCKYGSWHVEQATMDFDTVKFIMGRFRG